MSRRTPRLQRLALFGLVVTAGIGPLSTDAADREPDVQAVLKQLDSPRGICAILGDREADFALKLARASELLIYVQLPGAKDVQAARQAVHAAGMLNSRVYVERGDSAHVHLADNLADLVIVRGVAQGQASEKEVLRVLRPLGKGLLGSKTIVKKTLEGVDDWSHPYHGPDNNPQSNDQRARAPYLTQFLAEQIGRAHV